MQIFSFLNDLLPFVKCFLEAYPLAAEDTVYFLAILQRPEQKPVPFISVLDASFEVWIKKVSSGVGKFHASTDVNNFRIPCGLQKISRPSLTKSVCILQGPVAVK